MEAPESIRTSLNTGEWVTSIDLQDAYLHILIHPRSRKYLRFVHRSQIYQFTSLPFGLAPAPQVFTMIVKEVKLMALSWGKDTFKDTPISGRLANQGSISGGVISQHKSGGRSNRISRLDDESDQIGVDPNSSILFCGIRIPSKLSPCKAPSGEVAKLQALILRITNKSALTARHLMSLIGLLASTEKMVPEGHLHMRPFQWHLKENWTFPQSLVKLLPWSDSIIAHLDWWQNPQNVLKGADLHPQEHNVQVFTDD